MPQRLRTWSIVLAVLVAGCADGSSVTTRTFPVATTSTAATAPVTSQTTTSTVVASLPTTGFGEPIVVEVEQVTYEFTGAACLPGADAAEFVGALARQAAAEVERITQRRVSGWPTTTVAFEDTFDGVARVPAVHALALGSLVGLSDGIVEGWLEFENSYADSELGYPPVAEISYRLSEWRALSDRVVRAIERECSGRR